MVMYKTTQKFNEDTWEYLFRFSSGSTGDQKVVSEIKQFLYDASNSKVNIIVTAEPGQGKIALVKTLSENSARKIFTATLDTDGWPFPDTTPSALVLSGRNNNTILENAIRIGAESIANYCDRIDENHISLMLKAWENNIQLIYPYNVHMEQYIELTPHPETKLTDIFEIEVVIEFGLTQINQIVKEGPHYTLRPLWQMVDGVFSKVNEPNRKIRRKIQEAQCSTSAVRTDEYSEPMQAVMLTPSEKEKVMRLLSGEWDYIINDETLQKENQMNLAQRFEERLVRIVDKMHENKSSEILLVSDAKPLVSGWNVHKGCHESVVLEDEEPVLAAEILAFAGKSTRKSGVSPIFTAERPLTFSYQGMNVRVSKTSSGVMVGFSQVEPSKDKS